MPEIKLATETLERLDALRMDDASYEDVIEELINIYETEELTLSYAGDQLE